MGTFHEDQPSFMIVSCLILLRMSGVLKKVVEGIETHILCSITFFLKTMQFVR